MIPCPSCGEMFDPEAHPAIDTAEASVEKAESYANLMARCPNCGHEFAPE